MKVGKLRTGWGPRSGLTAINNSLALTSMPAASGCKMGNCSHRFFALFALAPPRTGRMPNPRIRSKLPIEIVVRADERHHTSVRKPRTHAYRRASEAPVSARAVAVIRPVPIIIALPLFLCTLFGKRQLHACRYQLISMSALAILRESRIDPSYTGVSWFLSAHSSGGGTRQASPSPVAV